MFYSQPMTDLQLIVPSKDIMGVTKIIAGQGVFHQVDASYLGNKPNSATTNLWKDRTAEYAVLERRILLIMEAIGVEEGKPESTEQASIIEIDKAIPQVEHFENEVHKVNKKLSDEQKKLTQAESLFQQIEPLAGIDIDMNALRNPRYIYPILGIIPSANIDRLQTSLARIPFVFLTLHQDKQKSVVWLAGLQKNRDVLERAARSAYLNPINLPNGYQGTPDEVLEAVKLVIEQTIATIAEQQAALSQLHKAYKQQLQDLLWLVRGGRMLADAVAHFGQLKYTNIIAGWVPSRRVEALTQQIRQVSKDILIDAFPSKRSSSSQNIPVALNNPRLIKPYQELVTTYAQPRYEELDPTILIAVTYPLLFGAMFGDVGHGLLLALLGGLVASRKVPILRGLAGLGGLIISCGLVSVVFGFLYGSVIGMENIMPSLWIRPMDNIITILLISIGAGIVLLSLGFFIGILNAWMARDWGRMFFDRNGIAGLVLFWAIIGLVARLFTGSLPIPPLLLLILAVISGIILMLSEVLKRLIQGHRPLIDENPATYVIQVFFELFETIVSFLSNSLSYVRIGAFAVAHIGLSSVFFILAGMVSPAHGIAYWIIVAVGTIFIVGFEGLIVGIQSLRLEYYEFFNKFFSGGGTRYRPITIVSPEGK